MPLYPFQHPSSGETIEIFFHMNDDDKKYIDEEGTEWKRIFSGVNLTPTYRSFDEKRLVDEKGNPLKVRHLSDEFIKGQGFDNATDYIDYNNSVMVNPEKSPEANLQRRADQLRDKDFQGNLKHQQRQLKERQKQAVKAKAATTASLNVEASLGKGKKQVFKVKKDK